MQLSESQVKRIKIKTDKVSTQSFPDELMLEGSIKEDEYQTTPIRAQAPGRAEGVFVEVGQIVKKGQCLATIRSDEVAKLEAELLEKTMLFDAEIRIAKVALELAEKQLNRILLLNSQGITAKSDLEVSEGMYQRACVESRNLAAKREAAIVCIKERLRLYGIEEKEVEHVLKSGQIDDVFSVISPKNGTIVSRDVDCDELIESSKQIFEISNLTSLWMNAQVFEKDIRKVKRGLKAKVLVDAFPEKNFDGWIKFVGTSINPRTRTLPIRATVNNDAGMLYPNMYGKMIVKVGNRSVRTIPKHAVQQVGETVLAYIPRGMNVFEERKIMLGQTIGNQCEVVSGLEIGEEVVTTGSLELQALALQN